MKKLAFVLLFVPFISFSQDSLSVKKGNFYKADQPLATKNFVMEMKDNPEAFKLASAAHTNFKTGGAFALISGFVIGYQLGTALRGGEPSWGLVAAGGAVLAIAITITISGSKKMKEAARVFNNSLATSSSTYLNLNLSPTKTGFVLYF